MPSSCDSGAADEFVTRLSRLRPDTPAKWGKFTAAAMRARVNDSMRMATGELAVKSIPTPFKNAFIRWLIIYLAPLPKRVPTAPQLLARCSDAEFAAECGTFKALLGTVLARTDEARWPDHPAFGSMSRTDWGVLGHKHTDHHFRQFGC